MVKDIYVAYDMLYLGDMYLDYVHAQDHRKGNRKCENFLRHWKRMIFFNEKESVLVKKYFTAFLDFCTKEGTFYSNVKKELNIQKTRKNVKLLPSLFHDPALF